MGLLFLALAAAIAYLLYVLIANTICTNILKKENERIDDLLGPKGHHLSRQEAWDDCACEVRWSVTARGTEFFKGLPSRVVYRHLIRWHRTGRDEILDKLIKKCHESEGRYKRSRFD